MREEICAITVTGSPPLSAVISVCLEVLTDAHEEPDFNIQLNGSQDGLLGFVEHLYNCYDTGVRVQHEQQRRESPSMPEPAQEMASRGSRVIRLAGKPGL